MSFQAPTGTMHIRHHNVANDSFLHGLETIFSHDVHSFEVAAATEATVDIFSLKHPPLTLYMSAFANARLP